MMRSIAYVAIALSTLLSDEYNEVPIFIHL